MARLALGVIIGSVITVATMTACGLHASEEDEASIAPEAPISPLVARANCVVWYESRWNPNAQNRVSGASGLGQFLPSTWRTTPQGKAGYSVWDPYANHAAVVWMLSVGRAREFDVVRVGLC